MVNGGKWPEKIHEALKHAVWEVHPSIGQPTQREIQVLPRKESGLLSAGPMTASEAQRHTRSEAPRIPNEKRKAFHDAGTTNCQVNGSFMK